MANQVQYNNNQFPHEIGNTNRHQTILVYNPTISQVRNFKNVYHTLRQLLFLLQKNGERVFV